MNEKRFIVTLPASLNKKLNTLKDNAGLSKADIIRLIMMKHLDHFPQTYNSMKIKPDITPVSVKDGQRFLISLPGHVKLKFDYAKETTGLSKATIIRVLLAMYLDDYIEFLTSNGGVE